MGSGTVLAGGSWAVATGRKFPRAAGNRLDLAPTGAILAQRHLHEEVEICLIWVNLDDF